MSRPAIHRPIVKLRTRRMALLALLALLPCHGLEAAPVSSATSRWGVVAAGSPDAAAVGASTLEHGGNAVDAAVATAFALIVTEPGMCGLGGRTVMLVGRENNRVDGLDAATQWPARWSALKLNGKAPRAPTGWGQIATPGTLAGLADAARRWGTRPLATLMRPAIHLARDGFRVSAIQARMMAKDAVALRADPALRRIYFHADRSPYQAGERLRQPELARTLRLIAREGPGVFYHGEIARAIVQEMKRHGGYVSAADLAGFRAHPVKADVLLYGDHRVFAMDRPAKGRLLLWKLRTLGQLPRYDEPLDDFHALVELLNLDPPEGPPGESDAENRRRLLNGDSYAASVRAVESHVQTRTTGLAHSPSPAPMTHTTHLAVVDRRGMVVSLTQSLGPYFGPKVALPRYGVTFASTMGYLDADAKDPSLPPESSIAPTLVYDLAGRPVMALGGAGSDQIPEAILQALRHALNEGRSLPDAIAAPRATVHRESARGKRLPNQLRMEANPLPSWHEWAAGLKARGVLVGWLPESAAVGRLHAVMRTRGGEWIGVADPRWFGRAVAVPAPTLAAPAADALQ